MRVLELFKGTGSVSKVCEQLGWDCISLDIEKRFNPDICCDIIDWNYKELDEQFDIIWASPPCTSYSKLQHCWFGRKRRIINNNIFTKAHLESLMKDADKIIIRLFEIIDYFKPVLWFIENPYGGNLKKRDIMRNINYYRVDYCKYSDWGYKKSTIIWTNSQTFIPLICKNDCNSMIGNKHKCNIGRNKTTLYQRFRVPENLIKSLFNIYENNTSETKQKRV